MSHRTILEFNHDYLHDLENDPEFCKKFLLKLKSNDWADRYTSQLPGVHKVGERHHSEKLVVEVNGHKYEARC